MRLTKSDFFRRLKNLGQSPVWIGTTRAELAEQYFELTGENNDQQQFVEMNITLDGTEDRNFLRRVLIDNEITGLITVSMSNSWGIQLRNVTYDIPRFASIRKWWDRPYKGRDWEVDYNGVSVFENGYTLEIKRFQRVSASGRVQRFRDGIHHCVFQPIINWAEGCLVESKSARAKQRYRKKVKDAKKLEQEYIKGVPAEQEHFDKITSKLQIDLVIDQPFQKEILESKSLKKRLKKFKFVNTRLDHIELNKVVRNDKNCYQECTQEQLRELKDKFDKENTFYTYTKNSRKICQLNTLEKVYTIDNKFQKTRQDFEKETGLFKCRIEHFSNIQLSNFILSSVHYNATVDFVDNIKSIKCLKHIDEKKAYTQFPNNPYYMGFCAVPTDFRECNKEFALKNIGFYQIKWVSMRKKKFVEDIYIGSTSINKHLEKLNFIKAGCIYTTPELRLFNDLGIRFEVSRGCWGVKPFHFKFDEKMMQKDDDGISYYARIVGKWNRIATKNHVYMNQTKEFWEQVAKTENVYHCESEGCIQYEKKRIHHLSHITSYITAYQRISLILQLLKIPYENVCRVCVDGIYYKDCEIEINDTFRPKDEIKLGNEAGYTYCSNLQEYKFEAAEFKDHYKTELHIGPGGSGKTHTNLTDKGFVNKIYVAPSWKLSTAKKDEFEVTSTVWSRMLDPFVDVDLHMKHYGVCIWDECSMMTESQKCKILKMFPYSKHIFCGDLGFQLPPTQGIEMTAEGIDYVFKYKKLYRCKCKKLFEIMKTVRKAIKQKYSRERMNELCKKLLKNRKIQIDYDIKDLILCSKHEYCYEWTQKYAGKFSQEKYRINDRRKLCGVALNNGSILITSEEIDHRANWFKSGKKVSTKKPTVQHAFTVHSIQGETAEEKLFIDTRRFFDARMFYTAISRARRLDQIYLL